MKDLVHVRLPLLSGDFGEDQTRHQEVGAAQSSEHVAFKLIHFRPENTPKNMSTNSKANTDKGE